MTTSFHFTKESPPDIMFTDIQTVNKFNNESSRLLSQLDDFAEQNGVGAGALRNVFKSLLSFPACAMKKHLSPFQIKEDLMKLGLSEDKCDHFADLWKDNLVVLTEDALNKTLMVNQLVDMEWKFGVTASSSELDKVGNTFLQLKLVISTGIGTRNTYMELTLPQFYSFLHEMEKAKASLEYLS
ncbi:COMM domain-containing protein 7-like isoform X3 [Gigantopelta aegis]|uniref:COMM domain-containing protein 7-like isoform X3 n=1 Tax=Gigantopelta aegis TaxID=1735272 RepID=UPI001B888866|nr:COMM domain-containing protein 7-like isoform X3 [Gigantopelta aegis]